MPSDVEKLRKRELFVPQPIAGFSGHAKVVVQRLRRLADEIEAKDSIIENWYTPSTLGHLSDLSLVTRLAMESVTDLEFLAKYTQAVQDRALANQKSK
jgi:hypothetical protein